MDRHRRSPKSSRPMLGLCASAQRRVLGRFGIEEAVRKTTRTVSSLVPTAHHGLDNEMNAHATTFLGAAGRSASHHTVGSSRYQRVASYSGCLWSVTASAREFGM